MRAALEGTHLADSGFFETAALTRLADQHESGQRDHSQAIWAAMMFESFLRQVQNGVVAEEPVFETRAAALG